SSIMKIPCSPQIRRSSSSSAQRPQRFVTISARVSGVTLARTEAGSRLKVPRRTSAKRGTAVKASVARPPKGAIGSQRTSGPGAAHADRLGERGHVRIAGDRVPAPDEAGERLLEARHHPAAVPAELTALQHLPKVPHLQVVEDARHVTSSPHPFSPVRARPW